jgi:ribonuclease HIII
MTKVIDIQRAENLKTELLKNDYTEFKQNNQYVLWSMKKDHIIATYYTSKKLYVNGNPEEILKLLNEKYESAIGADESGKGDYFGPLVVCAAFIPKDKYDKFYTMNIRDSKTISDNIIEKIFNTQSFEYEIKIIKPKEYNNEMKKIKNLNTLLTETYLNVITKLKRRTNPDKIVIDAYQNPRVIKNKFPYEINAFTKAEEKELSVALASIIARYFFIKELEGLSKEYNMEFPKGSTNVLEFAKEFVSKFGKEELENVAKMHFSITTKI